VADTSTKDIDDLYLSREILEGQAAFNAAEHLTDNDIKTLEVLLKEMAAELERQDYMGFMNTNRQFHFTIYNALTTST